MKKDRGVAIRLSERKNVINVRKNKLGLMEVMEYYSYRFFVFTQ